MNEKDRLVQEVDNVFTEEALRENDGKTVPIRLEFGGPVIGKATLKYDPGEKALKADFEVTDPVMQEFLKGPMPSVSFEPSGASAPLETSEES